MARFKNVPVKDRPDSKDLESGDLIWGRLRRRIVPLLRPPTGPPMPQSGPMTEKEWEEEKQQVLQDPQVPDEVKDRLRGMSFREFQRLYIGQPVGIAMPDQDWWVYSGHVAVIAEQQGEPYVVEAVKPHARKMPYQEWLKEWHGDPFIWQGRLKMAPDVVKKVVEEALRHEERKVPFDLWKFNLDDDSGFYCAKLVWFAVWRASGFYLDGRGPKREWLEWCTPLDLMKSHHVEMISQPSVDFQGIGWFAKLIGWAIKGILWVLRKLRQILWG